MKSTRFIGRIVSTLLIVAAFASASFAVSNPLNTPRGMAVDAKGNLWVANSGANNVVAFGSNYKQLTADTVTYGISEPTDVAFDTLGNLWVTNYAANTVTEYSQGVPQPANTITQDISSPFTIAIDGLNNIWVANYFYGGAPPLLVFEPTRDYGPANQLHMTFGTTPTVFYGVAVSDGELVLGSGLDLSFAPATVALTTGSISGTTVGGNNFATYVAAASNGTIYFATEENTINYATPSNLGYATQLLEVSFSITGLAVDSVHGRIYISNGENNSIAVYDTTGKLLHTIE
ncbi:MAG: hypothetical protein WAK29_14230 [Terriglobales bacterium]